MTDGKRFRDAVYGFNKVDVNLYIEKMIKDFDTKLRAKDEQINSLRNEYRELKEKYDGVAAKAQEIDQMRDKMTDVLLRAQEKAELMIQDATERAAEEKKKIEELVEQEKEKLVDIRAELKVLKQEVVSTLKKYEGQLGNILDNEAG